ncbi:MAG: hypothetical protein ACRBBS_03110 [Thalassovita sp.]
MTQLLIHIGPFKTGTTSFQNYMWGHREALLEQGVLYPKAGVFAQNFGARHLGLARAPKSKADQAKVLENFGDLRREIAANPKAEKVVLSAERMSQRIPALVSRKRFYEDYNPKLVVVVRDEVAMVRSMYFQIVKARFGLMKNDNTDDVKDFPRWFEGYKDKMSYPLMLQPWIDVFGADSIIFVPYEAHKKVNIITSLNDAMGLPHLEIGGKKGYQNPSIGGLAAAAAIYAADYGLEQAKRGMEFAALLEAEHPEMKKMDPKGYDGDAMRAYYDAQNAPAFEMYPAFKKAHDAATSRD